MLIHTIGWFSLSFHGKCSQRASRISRVHLDRTCCKWELPKGEVEVTNAGDSCIVGIFVNYLSIILR
jgi:hypothetical protein